MKGSIGSICVFVLSCLWATCLAEFSPSIKLNVADQVAKGIAYFDDSTNVLLIRDNRLYVSFDDGGEWKKVDETGKENIKAFQMDPFVKERALAFTDGRYQYVTNDKGKTWNSFELDFEEKDVKLNAMPVISFNAANKDLGVITTIKCSLGLMEECRSFQFYTLDGFKSNMKNMKIDSDVCVFARSSQRFSGNQDSTIFCSKTKKNSFGHTIESTLVASDDYFKSYKEVDHEMTKSGRIIDIKVVESFLIVVIQSDKFNDNSKVQLVISRDGVNFNKADFKVDFSYGVMAFMESSPSSLFISVMDYSNDINDFSLSTIFASDSTGLKFTKLLDHVNGGAIEKVQTIDGVWMADTAEKNEDDSDGKSLMDVLLGGPIERTIKSKITFNDGKEWGPLVIEGSDSCKASDGCSLHVLSPSTRDGQGKFVTGPTPGILMVVGSEGDKLSKDLGKMKTWISRNGGSTWTMAIDKPCLFSFGDQGNIIIAVPYFHGSQDGINHFYYSLDQGKSWKEQAVEKNVLPLILTTTVDGSSGKFILSGIDGSGGHDVSSFKEVMYTIDFSNAFDGRTCSSNDLEEVYARKEGDGNPSCIYGHREKFQRRKQDAQCLIKKIFSDVKVYDEVCDCTLKDLECAPGFFLEDDKCVVEDNYIIDLCASSKSKEVTIPEKAITGGNSCKMPKNFEKEFIKMRKFKCSDFSKGGRTKDTNSRIKTNSNRLGGELQSYLYLSNGNTRSKDIVAVRVKGKGKISLNGGRDFVDLPIHEDILDFIEGSVSGQFVILTTANMFFISYDGGISFYRRTTPTPPSFNTQAISFHKTNKNVFIWYGSENCRSFSPRDCPVSAYLTEDGGETFKKIRDNVAKCELAGSYLGDRNQIDKNLIYCSAPTKDDSILELISTTSNFKEETKVFEHIVDFVISGPFLIVGSLDSNKEKLMTKVSVDGKTFADALFPHDFSVDSHQAYTILDSMSNSIFMHVTTSPKSGREYGSILKSNSNGTSYVVSLDHVNRDSSGYVDYDRIQEIEGILVANIVENHKASSKEKKKLKTMVSHNDGAQWSYMVPPVVDSKGKKYKCSGRPLSKCSLNLHGFTERADYRDTFSSSSAVGLMVGVGNVGESLDEYDKGSTFLTRDGGLTWKEVQKGIFMWEFGDRGTVIVLVNAKEETNSLLYTLDEGESWNEYKFTDEKVKVLDLATVPSDTSLKFLIFAVQENDISDTTAFAVDFSEVYRRQCKINLDSPDYDDYEFWSPKHPESPDDCLFGHEARYLRRAIGHDDCFIGNAPLKEGFKVTRNCSCTRRDFECDYNFFRDTDNTCKLVNGLPPSDRESEFCSTKDAFEYFEPTGYRKIPLSTCVGGKEFDKWNAKPCPGKQKEFNQHYGKEIKGYKVFLVVGIPLFVFVFATWFVYDRGIRRNGGFKRFGQIRLDTEDDYFQPIEENDVDKAVNKVVRGGIYVAALSIAVFKTLRTIDKIIMDKIRTVIFRRSPGRRNYVQVPDIDDNELFGDFEDNFDENFQEGIDDNVEQDVNNQYSDDIPNESSDGRDSNTNLFNIDEQSDDETT